MKGKRKFTTTLIALGIFLLLMLVKDLDPQKLGYGLGAILFGFGIPNMMEHYRSKK